MKQQTKTNAGKRGPRPTIHDAADVVCLYLTCLTSGGGGALLSVAPPFAMLCADWLADTAAAVAGVGAA